MSNQNILNSLESLKTFSFYLSVGTKSDFEKDMDYLKKHINKNINEIVNQLDLKNGNNGIKNNKLFLSIVKSMDNLSVYSYFLPLDAKDEFNVNVRKIIENFYLNIQINAKSRIESIKSENTSELKDKNENKENNLESESKVLDEKKDYEVKVEKDVSKQEIDQEKDKKDESFENTSKEEDKVNTSKEIEKKPKKELGSGLIKNKNKSLSKKKNTRAFEKPSMPNVPKTNESKPMKNNENVFDTNKKLGEEIFNSIINSPKKEPDTEVKNKEKEVVENKAEVKSDIENELKKEASANEIVFDSDVKAPEIDETKHESKKLFIKPKENTQSHPLYSLLRIIIPRLTDKSKNMISESESTINKQLRLLKDINEKSSVAELYNMYSYNYENLLDFLNTFSELEESNYIKFVKSENIVYENQSWIKIGQILIECNVIHDINVVNALNYMKVNKGMKVGEAMVELRFISEPDLNKGLKVQKWLSQNILKAVYLEGIVLSDTFQTNVDEAKGIFDFIIPTLTNEAKEIIANQKSEVLKNLLSLFNEKSSLLNIYRNNEDSFKRKESEFFKIIHKLESQKFLDYKRNEETKERSSWVRFGELAINLGYIKEEDIEKSFVYRYKNPDKTLLIGETLIELGLMNKEDVDFCLKTQDWCNNILTRISYDNAFVTAIKDILEGHFNLPVNVGHFIKKAFEKPLLNMVVINYTFKGMLNGDIFYIFDRNFAEKLSKTVMESYGMDTSTMQLDESIISELCNMMSGKILTKLDKLGIFCETDLPKIIMNKEVVIANKQPINILPLTNDFGRFIVGFNLKDSN